MRTRTALTATLAAAGLVAVGVMPLAADEADLEITFDHSQGLRGETEAKLGTAVVPDDLHGAVCSMEMVVDNQSSAHPDNRLRVTSGTTVTTTGSIEGMAYATTSAEASVVLEGPEVTAEVLFGPDGVFSAKGHVALDCEVFPPGHCPDDGYEKLEDMDGMSWTADTDYDEVILVGGPPNEPNGDPDGRYKVFEDVEEGVELSREVHEISLICLLSVPEPTPTTPDVTPSDPVVEDNPTPDEPTEDNPVVETDEQDEAVEKHSHSSHEQETTEPTMTELPRTGLPAPALAGLAALLLGGGGALLRRT